MKTKNELRKYAKKLREQLDMKHISLKIIKSFQTSSFYKTAKNIFLYYPAGSEPDITPLFSDKTKNFFLPKISDNDNKMTFFKYEKGITKLKKNKYGILEPDGVSADSDTADLIILPALMSDKNGYRLGYGGGYYDRYLNENNIYAIKIILLPDELLTESLPTDDFDVSADAVITEKRIIKTQQK